MEYIKIGPSGGGRAESVIFFLHGYGANAETIRHCQGTDLGRLLPDAGLYFPQAPIALGRLDELGCERRSWFDAEDLLHCNDPVFASRATVERVEHTAAQMNRLINEIKWREGVPGARVIVAGYSQGASTAWNTVLRRNPANDGLGGVFCISAAAIDYAETPGHLKALPVHLAAGGLEDCHYSGVHHVNRAAPFLRERGFAVETYVAEGADHAHAVTAGVLEKLAEFARQVCRSEFRPARSLDVGGEYDAPAPAF